MKEVNSSPTMEDLSTPQSASDILVQEYFGQLGEKTKSRTQGRLHWLASQATGSKVLDVGISGGVVSILLAREGFQVAVAKAPRENLQSISTLLKNESTFINDRINLMQEDFYEADLEPESFDSVLISDLLNRLARPEFFLERAFSLLRPGGVFALTVAFGILENPEHLNTYTISRLIELLQPHCAPRKLSVEDNFIRFSGFKKENATDEWSEYSPVNILTLVERASLEKEASLQSQLKTLQQNLDNAQRLIEEERAVNADMTTLASSQLQLSNALASRAFPVVQRWLEDNEPGGRLGVLQESIERTSLLEEACDRQIHLLRETVKYQEKRSSISRGLAVAALGRSRTRKDKKRIRQEIKTLERSKLFDPGFYAARYPDIATSGVNPLEHFVRFGWVEFRDPNPYFNTFYYLFKNEDVVKAMINPLLHFFNNGAKESRNPSAVFDVSYYLANNPDVAAAGMNPLAHYMRFGHKEGRQCRP